ncbi:TetR/AcrR family transcriptional regulator [Chloroflexus sp.]|uniref:TetR/AcrR family transcriptional regulator n=1 Tax=Chloroflexus sp. TaxID=1904827 RepID=UPI002ACF0971|nr:TetR/AcrR family transcriptional regulator [Chloroflexus sp.]
MAELNLALDPRISDSPTALRILDVAAQLFMQRGYRAVSINDIIQAAGVTKPTLYYYFGDKEDLFVQMGLRVLETMCQPLAEIAASDQPLVERLQAMATLLITGYEGDMRMMRHEMMEHLGESARARLSAAFYQHLFAPLTSVMNEARIAGLVRADLAPAVLAMLFLSLCETFHELTPAHPMLRWTGAVSPALLVDLFLHGAGTQAAPKSSTGMA